MVKRRQARQRRWITLATIGAFILFVPMMTGCASTPTTAQHHIDPLIGHRTPPGSAAPPNAPNASHTPIAPPPQTGSTNSFPPIPANNTATNPATLAGATGIPVSLAKPLAIDDEGRAKTTARSQPPGFVPANATPKFEAVPDVNASAPHATPIGSWQLPMSNVPPTLPPVDSVQAVPTDALRQQLQARGVVNQKVDPTADGVRLTCYVPRSDSQGLRVLEVSAADYPTAAQAILRQLDPRAP
jgi:hypothetical protein